LVDLFSFFLRYIHQPKNHDNRDDLLLTPSLEEIMKRIKIRARPGEENVKEEYQLILKKYHDEILNTDYVSLNNTKIPVYKLETNKNFKDDENVKQEIIDLLEPYITTI